MFLWPSFCSSFSSFKKVLGLIKSTDYRKSLKIWLNAFFIAVSYSQKHNLESGVIDVIAVLWNVSACCKKTEIKSVMCCIPYFEDRLLLNRLQWGPEDATSGKDQSLFLSSLYALCCVVSMFSCHCRMHRRHCLLWHLVLFRVAVSLLFIY